ncbi:hypothetical protein Acr_00g0083950 [Actinidia rufa]|uniref:Uncharacterized protein n=1 Tax=Actinidia rufa TaxID=165716 RepID=A0A7J0DVD7_9ERIC|nr:hypothetical protein Acr_00g0083950 [Actinidia rufa]
MEGDDEFKRTEWETDMSRFIRVMADTKNHLLKLDGDTKMEVLRVLIKIPKLDEVDVYNLTTMALQNKSNSSIPRDHVEGVCGVSNGGEREERLPRYKSLNDPPRLTLEAETQIREEVANLMKAYKSSIHDEEKAVLVIEKQLYYSDVNKDSGRLSMPLNQVMLTDFLSQGEMELLHNHREIKAKILSEPLDQEGVYGT